MIEKVKGVLGISKELDRPAEDTGSLKPSDLAIPPYDIREFFDVVDTTFEKMTNYYSYLWSSCSLLHDQKSRDDVEYCVNLIMKRKDKYQIVEQKTGVPWFIVGCLHGRESAFNFNSCLHNGDPLGTVTVHVPKGRGPFFTWTDAAIDALNFEGMANETEWSITKALWACEKYNGFGYFRRKFVSPYVWSHTTNYSKGKYVADGKFDPEKVDPQVGIAAMIRMLIDKKLIEEI